MTDHDIHAFAIPAGAYPPGAAARAPGQRSSPHRPRRVWPWVLVALAVLAVGAALSLGAALASWIDAAQQGVHIGFDGGGPGLDFHLGQGGMTLGSLTLGGLGLGLLAALALVLLLLPCALLLLMAAILVLAGLGVAGGLAAAMGVALLIGAALLAPIMLPLWLLLRLLRS
jgi:hypothetical protein